MTDDELSRALDGLVADRKRLGAPSTLLEKVWAIPTTTTSEPHWLPRLDTGRFHSMLSATKFVVAGVIVALFGGLLVSSGGLWRQPEQQLPAAGVASPVASAPSAPASMPPAEATQTTDADPGVPDEAIIMRPARTDTRVGGYSQIGRITDRAFPSGSIGGAVGPVTLRDRLVLSMLRIDGDGEGHSAIFTTTDGQMWLPSEMPGRTPSVDDMATTSDGLLAVGHDGDYPAWQAMLWTTEDGAAWTTLEAPPDTGYMRIVSSEAPLAVASPQWLWIRGEDGEWVRGTRLAGLTVRSGPSGFLAWDSGESGVSRPVLMHSRDLLEWRDVDLSASPSLEAAVADRGSVIFATDDEWILVPRRSRLPDSILTSSDGDVWQQVPRPPGMDSPSWIVRIGDQVQAYESPGDGRNDYRLWTWQLGEMAASPEESKTSLGGPPVEWQGSWITRTSRGPHNRELTFWRSDGEPRS